MSMCTCLGELLVLVECHEHATKLGSNLFAKSKKLSQNHTKSSINQFYFFPKTKTESFFQNQELDHTGM